MSRFRTLRAGVFLPPFHPNDEDPLLCMERDFQLMQWLDMHNYAEAWIAILAILPICAQLPNCMAAGSPVNKFGTRIRLRPCSSRTYHLVLVRSDKPEIMLRGKCSWCPLFRTQRQAAFN
jgi:hypothetical protein